MAVRWTIVWGGLGYRDFGKSVALRDGVLELSAAGSSRPAGGSWRDLLERGHLLPGLHRSDPFAAMEKYGRAMRAANHAHPSVYDFPLLCGWAVGALSNLPDVDNTASLVGELEAVRKAGVTRYTKVGSAWSRIHIVIGTGAIPSRAGGTTSTGQSSASGPAV